MVNVTCSNLQRIIELTPNYRGLLTLLYASGSLRANTQRQAWTRSLSPPCGIVIATTVQSQQPTPHRSV